MWMEVFKGFREKETLDISINVIKRENIFNNQNVSKNISKNTNFQDKFLGMIFK